MARLRKAARMWRDPEKRALARRALAPGAIVHVATDVQPYAMEIFAMLAGAGFRRVEVVAPGVRASGFGLKYLAQGKAVFSASFALT